MARQLVTEGVLLSLGGAACGVVLSFWACAEITRMVFEEYLVPVVFDGRPDRSPSASSLRSPPCESSRRYSSA